jgi:hypothetical protein
MSSADETPPLAASTIEQSRLWQLAATIKVAMTTALLRARR